MDLLTLFQTQDLSCPISPPSSLLLGDGAMGTTLQDLGLPPGVGSERWCLERPEAVRAVHAAHQAAGARWVQTNSFGANGGRLAMGGLAALSAAINAASVRLARQGAPGLPVFGCLGPTTAPSADWERLYAEQAEALAAAGVDGFIVETIVSVGEGVAAVVAACAVNSGPVFATYTPDAEGNVLDGAAPEAAAEALRTAGAVVAGVNCGAGPQSLLEPARRLVQAGIAPVLAAPSAGLPEWPEGPTGRARYPLNTYSFACAALQFQEAGVALFAGCCGVSATHLQAAARALHGSPK